jgi:hypothetical protein
MTRARVRLSEETLQRLLRGHTIRIRIAGVAEVEVSKEQPRASWSQDIFNIFEARGGFLSLFKRLCSLE